MGCDKVITGTVRRAVTCLCFSQDGAWLFAGTASGDVLTVNVARKAVQVGHIGKPVQAKLPGCAALSLYKHAGHVLEEDTGHDINVVEVNIGPALFGGQ